MLVARTTLNESVPLGRSERDSQGHAGRHQEEPCDIEKTAPGLRSGGEQKQMHKQIHREWVATTPVDCTSLDAPDIGI